MSKHVAHILTEEQIAVFREAFDAFAKDGNLSTSKLVFVMRSLGQDPTAKELRKIINEIDVDSNGIISFEEFIGMVARNVATVDSRQELREAFEVFDLNKDGFIGPVELRHVMRGLGRSLTDEELEEMIREADSNDDGLVSYEDVIQLLVSMKSSPGRTLD
ncbi:calmodulin-A-like [Bacillus rossius redtenbacheri]|uniref:calmodulin-A-like n=1 Tax=Bacillus rossius redtenbacheri TaxID=93214 RepID=UPI002FDD74FA